MEQVLQDKTDETGMTGYFQSKTGLTAREQVLYLTQH
jgi:hypothetical protein